MSRCASLSSIASAIAQATARGPTATRGFRRAEEKPAAVPATLGAGARVRRLAQSWPFQALSGPRRTRRSPWADYPAVESLCEPSGPNEPQPVPALTPLTHNCPVEPSNRKLLQHALDEKSGGCARMKPSENSGSMLREADLPLAAEAGQHELRNSG
jgi:hypothetical protein